MKSVITRLSNLSDMSCEFCVYKWFASHLSRPKLCNECRNLSQPVTAVCIFTSLVITITKSGLRSHKVYKSSVLLMMLSCDLGQILRLEQEGNSLGGLQHLSVESKAIMLSVSSLKVAKVVNDTKTRG